MTDLIIVGAGGFGREMVDIVEEINAQEPTWNLLGFIDDDVHKQGTAQNGYKVIGTVRDWEVQDGTYFAIAVAKPEAKKNVVESLKSRGARFAAIIHPNVKISPSATIGKALVAYSGAGVGPDVQIGNYVTILHSGIGHDAQIGDYSTVSSYCGINGGVSIEDGVYIGSHATFVPGIHVGRNATVGIGSVVMRNVKAGSTVLGNPARRITI